MTGQDAVDVIDGSHAVAHVGQLLDGRHRGADGILEAQAPDLLREGDPEKIVIREPLEKAGRKVLPSFLLVCYPLGDGSHLSLGKRAHLLTDLQGFGGKNHVVIQDVLHPQRQPAHRAPFGE